ncbi:MAG: DUF2721 domain-containing protein [Deltaproteobacteria bacterium]|jgi:hypothetical protein|nr:DUF2721 domain-containing protein [Deltaproteobacteria bacterium]
MEITLTTPALLFPAVSLLLVAYTNRFLALGSRIRSLHTQFKSTPDDLLEGQIIILRKRVVLIRNMQFLGVGSLFLCVLCMFLLFGGKLLLGKIIFGTSLVLMLGSLGISLQEILISMKALNLELGDMEKEDRHIT